MAARRDVVKAETANLSVCNSAEWVRSIGARRGERSMASYANVDIFVFAERFRTTTNQQQRLGVQGEQRCRLHIAIVWLLFKCDFNINQNRTSLWVKREEMCFKTTCIHMLLLLPSVSSSKPFKCEIRVMKIQTKVREVLILASLLVSIVYASRLSVRTLNCTKLQ